MKLTGQQIQHFILSARSLSEMNLGRAAQRKWYDTHKGTAHEDDALFESGTGMSMIKSLMEEIEAEGRDSKTVLAAHESTFNGQMEVWLNEAISYGALKEHERDEIVCGWKQQAEAKTREMDALAIQIKAFIEAD